MNQGPKKILYVITKSNWGGAGRYVFDMATHLPKDQFEVAVALGGSGLLRTKLDAACVRTIPIQSLQRDISFAKEIMALRELVSIFKREKPDVVHLNSSKAGGLGALTARVVGIHRIIFTVHGWPFLENRNLFSRGIIWVASWLTALLSTKIICVSDYDVRVARQMPFVSHKIVRIYNGIDLQFQLHDGAVIRDSFPKGVRITGTIGELTHNKNQISLIEEARKTPDMYVAIVGDGEDRAFLKGKIEEYGLEARVKLVGFMEAGNVLRGFDVFALPSIKEGLPYVLIEARAAGIPIIANRVGGVGEILDAPDVSEFSLLKMVQRTTALY